MWSTIRGHSRCLRRQLSRSLSVLSQAPQHTITDYDLVSVSKQSALEQKADKSPDWLWMDITNVFWWKLVSERSKYFTLSCLTWNCSSKILKPNCNGDLNKGLNHEQRPAYLQFPQTSKKRRHLIWSFLCQRKKLNLLNHTCIDCVFVYGFFCK